ncbi:hypothetical protein [Caenimonas sp. SL110]|uniref:hypothetical protein n=1 Tax=Caenimonas sp. SL110 TaxID=1450524 RepID=UPI001379329A|nr:hypothetical protein [Caenimonas sp. SL110]
MNKSFLPELIAQFRSDWSKLTALLLVVVMPAAFFSAVALWADFPVARRLLGIMSAI